MTVPIVASELLPIGLRGAFLALVLAAFLSTHDTYMHAWASVLVRDVIEPIRGKPADPKNELRLLRMGVLLVAVLILIISLTLKPSDYLLKFMVLSASVFIGGAGAVLIGGLYTSWGSTWGAWLSLAGGSLAALVGIVSQSAWSSVFFPLMNHHIPGLLGHVTNWLQWITDTVPGIHFELTPDRFPIDGQWWSLLTMLLASVLYVFGSLLERSVTGRKPTPPTSFFREGAKQDQRTEPFWLHALKSMLPTSEYTKADRVIWGAKMVWTGGLFVVFTIGTVAALVYEVDDAWWSRFWEIYLWAILMISIIITFWFGIGAIRDGARFLDKVKNSSSDSTP